MNVCQRFVLKISPRFMSFDKIIDRFN